MVSVVASEMSSLGEQMALAASVISDMAQQNVTMADLAVLVDEGDPPWSRNLGESAKGYSKTGLHRILTELALFVALTAVSEMSRLILRCCCPNTQVLQAHNRVCSLVLGWYSTSITLLLFNKWVIAEWQDAGLRFPVFYTMNHMFLKGIFALLYHIITCREMPSLNRKVLWGTVLVGVCTGLDVALSNLSLQYLTASFYTMLKSCSMLFILVFGIILKLEPLRFSMFGVVAAIVTGLLLTSAGEINFDWFGFTLVIFSEIFAALRWLLTQLLLQRANLSTVTIVLLVAPGSTLSLVPFALAIESSELQILLEPGVLWDYLQILLVPGVLAFLLLLFEVQLVKSTSSLTMSVFGNLKSVVTIAFAIAVFGEESSLIQWIGIAVALSGIFGYSFLKHIANKADTSEPLLAGDVS
mmetsp:Transcript_25650/g.59767  ORF Transcript_25650/g.59767 Transcript_25650/m.59767 type:complete len:413 (-) Transcript_25650:116-1354(-)